MSGKRRTRDSDRHHESVSKKVQRVIEDLLNSCDPYESKHDRPGSPLEIAEDAQEMLSELNQKIDKLYSFYENEVKQSREKERIEKEARSYLNNAKPEEMDLIAMKRETLRKFVEMTPQNDSEDLWMYSLGNTFDRNEIKELETNLQSKLAEIRDEISQCKMALSSLLTQGMAGFTMAKLIAYRDILNECKLLTIHEDPESGLLELCGEHINDLSIKNTVNDSIELTKLLNTYKEYLLWVFLALQGGNKQKFAEIQNEIIEKGYLLEKQDLDHPIADSIKPKQEVEEEELFDVSLDE
ncbi:unnamed protein product [Blepharisma stoltei]|uniref:Uncharacterized protein n=1 Tax=Blepharisma stoltei TaxID=1481888 RepID=A0AAU9JBC1_9CILI|nr:unnamed protein product [Blepharisma stoltei]